MKLYQELVQSLDQLVTVYRHLLDIVRKENEILIQVDMKQIPQINLAKEKLVLKVKQLDGQWQLAATGIAKELNFTNIHPTLLEIASHFSTEESVKLEQLHSVLNALVSRIAEINKKNAILVQSALSHITGAMSSITNTLNENPTYRNSGNMEKTNSDAQGRLVQREA